MSTHKGYALIAILVTAAVAGVIPAFAANELACPDCMDEKNNQQEMLEEILPIMVWTDKTAYDHQSMIKVSGHVRDPTNQQISLTVISPIGNVVSVEQLEHDNNGDFVTMLNTASSLWMKSGFYTIMVQYGGDSRANKVQVEIVEVESEIEITCETSEVPARLGNEVYCIPYDISGGSVESGTLDIDSKSLIVKISTESDGEITVHIPRTVLDAKDGNKDESFYVVLDNEEAEFDETKSSTTRSVTIQFVAGAEEIEIIGTWIIPEFGPIAALVLAVAIISIIAVSAKTRLRLVPKF